MITLEEMQAISVSDLTTVQKSVLIFLLFRRNNKTNICAPSFALLSFDLNCNISTTKRAVKYLSDINVLNIKKKVGLGGQAHNSYFFNLNALPKRKKPDGMQNQGGGTEHLVAQSTLGGGTKHLGVVAQSTPNYRNITIEDNIGNNISLDLDKKDNKPKKNKPILNQSFFSSKEFNNLFEQIWLAYFPFKGGKGNKKEFKKRIIEQGKGFKTDDELRIYMQNIFSAVQNYITECWVNLSTQTRNAEYFMKKKNEEFWRKYIYEQPNNTDINAAQWAIDEYQRRKKDGNISSDQCWPTGYQRKKATQTGDDVRANKITETTQQQIASHQRLMQHLEDLA